MTDDFFRNRLVSGVNYPERSTTIILSGAVGR